MSKIVEIFSGWKNLIWRNKEIERLAKKRVVICINCPDLKPDNSCGICGCHIPAKVRSRTSSCPAKKW